MNSLPNLLKLLQEPTVLILGAGASKDYRFPLWGDLKPQFLKKISVNPRNFSDEAINYWSGCLNSDTSATVDLLAAKAKPEGQDLFQVYLGQILIEHEFSDKDLTLTSWIENLTAKLLDIGKNPETRKLLKNFSIINFNYDRCFDSRYLKKFIKPLWDSFESKWTRGQEYQAIQRDVGSFSHIVHPHGMLGSISYSHDSYAIFRSTGHTFYNPSNGVELAYGDKNRFEKYIENDQLYYLPVDVFSQNSDPVTKGNPSYREAINRVNMAQNIVIVGMSELGWQHQRLSKNEGANYWSTGTTSVGDYIACLNMYADQFADQL